jgi:hypothetical protein
MEQFCSREELLFIISEMLPQVPERTDQARKNRCIFDSLRADSGGYRGWNDEPACLEGWKTSQGFLASWRRTVCSIGKPFDFSKPRRGQPEGKGIVVHTPRAVNRAIAGLTCGKPPDAVLEREHISTSGYLNS